MSIIWSLEALHDVDRLGDFVATYDPVRANEIERELSEAPKRLPPFPRRGPRLSEFEPLEVREHRIGRYVLRYQLIAADIVVLRCFHARENRTDPLAPF